MESGILAIVESGILHIAIKHFAKSFGYKKNTTFISNWPNLKEGNTLPNYIIIESEKIPSPIDVSLAELINHNPNSRILLIKDKPCPNCISDYIFDIINLSDDSNLVRKKLTVFFNTDSSNLALHEEIISDREKDIVKLVALGKTNKEISDTLFISPHTVITHRKNITSKLGIKTIAGLTVYAILNGLINPESVDE